MNKITDLKNILIKGSKSLRDAMIDLNNNGIQLLLLKNSKGKLIGLLTDGDIRRYILSNGPMDISVEKIANKNFIKCLEHNEITLEKLFDQENISHVPVLDEEGRVKYLATKYISKKIKKIDVPVAIVAGGQGTRLSPLTKIIPKPLIPVGEVTMIEKIMENFHNQGLSDFKIIINYKKNLIKTYLNELDHPYNIEFIEEKKIGDTAGSLALLKKLKGPFIVSNCDVIANINYQSLLDWHSEKKAEMTILGVQKQVTIPYGVIKMSAKNEVEEIQEKPSFNNMIVSGIYVMSPSVLKLIPKSMIIGMDELIKKLIKKKMNLTCFPIEDGWQDIGQFEEYKKLLEI